MTHEENPSGEGYDIAATLLGDSKMGVTTLKYVTPGLLLANASLSTKRKLLFILGFAPTLRHELISCAESYPQVVTHLYRMLYLLSRTTSISRIELRGSGDHQMLLFACEGRLYRFEMNVLPKGHLDLTHDLYPIVDVFSLRQYDYYPIREKKVVDVGGYIGDTAVYFAAKGARSVATYEPNPVNFRYLLSNLGLNGVSSNVEARRLAVSTCRGSAVLHVPYHVAGRGSLARVDVPALEFEVGTIDPREVLEEPVDLLKLDCKGCEIDLISACGEGMLRTVGSLICQTIDLESLSSFVQALRRIGYVIDKIDRSYFLVYSRRP